MSYDYGKSDFGALVNEILEVLDEGRWEKVGKIDGRWVVSDSQIPQSALILSDGVQINVIGSSRNTPSSSYNMRSINVARKKGPQRIAREIERRLLPHYRAALAHRIAEQQRHDAYQEACRINGAEVAHLMQARLMPVVGRGKPWLTKQPEIGSVRGRYIGAKVKIDGDFHILTLSLPHPQSVAVLTLLAEMWGIERRPTQTSALTEES